MRIKLLLKDESEVILDVTQEQKKEINREIEGNLPYIAEYKTIDNRIIIGTEIVRIIYLKE